MTTASNTARPRIRQTMHVLALAGILATGLPAAAFADDHRDRDRYDHHDRDRHHDHDRYEDRDHDHRDGYDRNRYDHNRYDRNRYDRKYSGYDNGRRVQVVWIRHGDHWHPNYANGRAWNNDYCGRPGYQSYTYYGRSAPRDYYYYDNSRYDGRRRDNTGAIVAGVGIGLLGLAIATSGN